MPKPKRQFDLRIMYLQRALEALEAIEFTKLSNDFEVPVKVVTALEGADFYLSKALPLTKENETYFPTALKMVGKVQNTINAILDGTLDVKHLITTLKIVIWRCGRLLGKKSLKITSYVHKEFKDGFDLKFKTAYLNTRQTYNTSK